MPWIETGGVRQPETRYFLQVRAALDGLDVHAGEAAMDLYLDAKETQFLTGLLERDLQELRREIHHTDTRSFKAELKADEALMEGLLGRLKTPMAMGI